MSLVWSTFVFYKLESSVMVAHCWLDGWKGKLASEGL